MSGLSLVVKGARVSDGSGRPGYLADVGVSGDEIAVIGRIDESAANGARVLDGSGLSLAPGFIDIHTHYDAHLSWDGMAAPSPEHGVTSIVIGNCSVSLAPYEPAMQDMLLGVFESVEDIKPDQIRTAVPFTWRTVPEYLRYLADCGLGPNVGMLVGYTMLRTLVMGPDAQSRPATLAEIERMAGIMEEAVAAGAMGLSMTYIHRDPAGRSLPNVFAEPSEIEALCRAMMRGGRGMLEVAPDFGSREAQLDILDVMGRLSVETGVAASLDGIIERPGFNDLCLEQLDKLEEWQGHGARLTAQMLIRPLDQVVNLAGTVMTFTKLDSWADVMLQDVSHRIAAFNDPVRRHQMCADADRTMDWVGGMVVLGGQSSATESLVGRTVRSVAAERGIMSMTEAMLQIALRDDLAVDFGMTGVMNADSNFVAQILSHPLTHAGAGDAGAHVSQFAGAGDTAYLFEHYVRKLGKFTVDEAVHMLSGKLAGDWGIARRGTIAIGNKADLVLFDPQTIARGEQVRVNDYPGNSSRWIRRPSGISTVIVNGQSVFADGDYETARPGRIV